MAEQMISWSVWTAERRPVLRAIGGRMLSGARELERDESFVWRQGRADVTLERAGDQWKVTHTAIGRLLGPRQTLYSGTHNRADFAAWDVMARVINSSRDEELGVEVARKAARWMRDRGASLRIVS
jgi:hypothetical protein